MLQISVIIVTYNNEKTIEECLISIGSDCNNRKKEIIVIDNASSDNTVTIIEELIKNNTLDPLLIRNNNNAGFTRGVNQGLEIAGGEYILILNPDTVIHRDFFEILIDFLSSNEEAGIAAPQHLSENGIILPSCREFPNHLSMLFYMTGLSLLFSKSKLFNSWKMGYFDHDKLMQVDQPMGACLLFRKTDLMKIGLLDERFFMFFSDVDVCKRFVDSGKKVYFVPDAKITHLMGHSIHQRQKSMIISSHKAFFQYLVKYYRGVRWFIPNAAAIVLLTVTALFRITMSLINGR